MADTLKLAEYFVEFADESEDKLHALRREWLDAIRTSIEIETTDTVKSTLAAEIPRIESIFIPEDTPTEKIQEQLAESVRTWVCSRAMVGQSLTFFLVGKDHGIEIYLADDEARTELLEGAFPGISFGAKSNPCRQASSFSYSSLITGVPTAVHKETALAYSCDQLLRGMRGRHFMLALVAKPVPRMEIQGLLQHTRYEIEANHLLIKQRLTESLGESVSNTIGASVGFSAGIFAALVATISISGNVNWNATASAAPMGVGLSTSIGGGGSLSLTLGLTMGTHLSANASINASRTKGRNSTRSSDEEKNNQFAQAYESKLTENESRLTTALSEGLWQVATYMFADTKEDLETCSSIYQASLTSRFDPQEVFRHLPILSLSSVKFGVPRFVGQPQERREAFTFMTTSELSSMIALPIEDHPGIIVKRVPKFSQNTTCATVRDEVVLGHFCDRNVAIQNRLGFSSSDMTGHTLIAGITGSGKSTTIRTILSQVQVPFLVLEPAKSEYRNLKIAGVPIRVITAGDEASAPLRINPFEIAEGDTLHSNIDALSATINAAFPMEGPMAALVEQGLLQAYKKAGWDISTGAAPDDFRVPTMNEFYAALEETIDEQKYEGEYGSNIKSALLTRINSLRIGPRGRLFNNERPFDVKDLLSRPTVVEMKKIGSDETKAFLTGILLYRVYRHFENQGQSGSDASLKSVLVIEEAHRLFRKATENGGGITGNNTKYHSVEMFENIMAEVRSYGLGLVIADQLPLRLSDGAVKNTNIKIVHRLAAREDAIVMGGGMGLGDKQSAFINILPRGEALVICPNLLEAAHIKVNLCEMGFYSTGKVSDEEVRREWSKSGSVFRPPHFDTLVERITEKDPEFLCKSGSRFLLTLQLCSIKHVNTFWREAVWQLFNDLRAFGCPVNTTEADQRMAHLLHYAVDLAVRQRKYLSWQQRQELLCSWGRCLWTKGAGTELVLGEDAVLEVKMQLEGFCRNNLVEIPRWMASVTSSNRIIPLFNEAEVFAEDLFQDRGRDIATTIRHDIAASTSIVAQRIQQLGSAGKKGGDRFVDFGFAVMIHLLDRIRPDGYEKPVFQSKIYGVLAKTVGGRKS